MSKKMRNPERLAMSGIIEQAFPPMPWRRKVRIAKRCAVVAVLAIFFALWGLSILGSILRAV